MEYYDKIQGPNGVWRELRDTEARKKLSGVQIVDTTARNTSHNIKLNQAPQNIAVTAYGKTTQSGSGDPSPSNVRQIAGVGITTNMVVLDGTKIYNYSNNSAPGYAYIYVSNAFNPSAKVGNPLTVISKTLGYVNRTAYMSNMVGVSRVEGAGTSVTIVLSVPDLVEFGAVEGDTRTYSNAAKAYFAENPTTVLYLRNDASTINQYLTWVSVKSEDDCNGYVISLSAPLFDGDTVSVDKSGLVTVTRKKRRFVIRASDGFERRETGQLRYPLYGIIASASRDVLCTHAISGVNWGGDGVYIDIQYETLTFGGAYGSRFTSADDWRAYLEEQYAAGTPVTVLYQLKTPAVETYQLDAPIATTNEMTNTVESEAEHEVTAAVDTKWYIDNKFNELFAAVSELTDMGGM